MSNKQAPLLIDQVNMDAIDHYCNQIYFRDEYTARHAEHVAELMAGLAAYLDFAPEQLHLAYMVGLMHDVGKIHTPEYILNKPGRLTDEELAVMKQHAQDGAELLGKIEGMEPVVEIIRHHHERWDGNGYPKGLKQEDIPPYSRMLSLCDAFDAMTSLRCYRSPICLKACLAEITSCSGVQFDPELCRHFTEFIREHFGFYE